MDEDMEVENTTCSCNGGKGFCKHETVLCTFVKFEGICSKTNQPMIWNKPTEKQFAKYKGGCQIRKMKNPEIKLRQPSRYSIDSIENVSTLHLTSDS
ncbi:hypothetical protein HHI36_014306 [Cryptolaemus montrouzieri]|uniref:Uncharacterized protein n=1 Tax=Cryptolaemus montrouzieri TaxID=559131 RepID=A0ABD2N2H3_9CUCU